MGKNFNNSVVTPSSPKEQALGLGRGLSLPAEPTSLFESEEDLYLPEEKNKSSDKPKPIKNIINMLVDIGDELDRKGGREDIVMANFADFLIKKFSEETYRDYTEMLNGLLLKISDSDIVNSNDIVVDLVVAYSRLVALMISSGEAEEDSKRKAYYKVVNKAESYVK